MISYGVKYSIVIRDDRYEHSVWHISHFTRIGSPVVPRSEPEIFRAPVRHGLAGCVVGVFKIP